MTFEECEAARDVARIREQAAFYRRNGGTESDAEILAGHLVDALVTNERSLLERSEKYIERAAIDCGISNAKRGEGQPCPWSDGDCAECKLYREAARFDCGLKAPARERGDDCAAEALINEDRCALCEAAKVEREQSTRVTELEAARSEIAKTLEFERREHCNLTDELDGLRERLAEDPDATRKAEREAKLAAAEARLDCGLPDEERGAGERCHLARDDGPGNVCAECLIAGIGRSCDHKEAALREAVMRADKAHGEARREALGADELRRELAVVTAERNRLLAEAQRADKVEPPKPRPPRKAKPPADAAPPGQGAFSFAEAPPVAPVGVEPTKGRRRRSDAGKARGPRVAKMHGRPLPEDST